jgi:hypothetical protein
MKKVIAFLFILICHNSYCQKTVTWYRVTADSGVLNYNPFSTGITTKITYYNINPVTGEQHKYNGNGTWSKDSLFSSMMYQSGVAWVSNWNDFINALGNSNVRSINLSANLTATSKAYIPTNQSSIKEIEGHGFEINIPSSIDTGFVRRYASLSQANQGIDQQLRFRNVSFRGGNTNMCMYISANYGMKIEGCRFYNFTTALDLRWCMGSIIDQCYFWENYIGVNLDYDRFSGGSNSTSCSNHSVVQNCKFRNSPGDFANIKVHAASGIQILHNIFEGQLLGGDYDVYFDDNGSTVVKEVTMYGNHVEHKPAIASFYIRLKDGFAKCGGIYSQYDCTLIKFESSAYAKCIVDNIPYLTSGTKFENVNSNGRWWFTNMPVSFNPNITTYWINGVAPSNSRYDGWNSNGQSPFLQLGTRTP